MKSKKRNFRNRRFHHQHYIHHFNLTLTKRRLTVGGENRTSPKTVTTSDDKSDADKPRVHTPFTHPTFFFFSNDGYIVASSSPRSGAPPVTGPARHFLTCAARRRTGARVRASACVPSLLPPVPRADQRVDNSRGGCGGWGWSGERGIRGDTGRQGALLPR